MQKGLIVAPESSLDKGVSGQVQQMQQYNYLICYIDIGRVKTGDHVVKTHTPPRARGLLHCCSSIKRVCEEMLKGGRWRKKGGGFFFWGAKGL